jgi:S-DNA-T family DNA segregation ATPase FtsK/SpoIIIE
MIAAIEDIMKSREVFFRDNRIDSMATYRTRRAAGDVDDGYGDIFLVVDGWGTLRTDFELQEQRIQVIVARGLTVGVHLIVGVGRWMELRQQVKDVLGTRLELRIGDPLDSVVDRQIAALVPENRSGRGANMDKHHFLGALPRIDKDSDVSTLKLGVDDAVAKISEAWHGTPGPKLVLLPDVIELAQLRQEYPQETRLLLGKEENHLEAFCFDPQSDSHLFAFGDSHSGKTGLLRSLAFEIMRSATPEQAQIYLVDPRRTLLSEIHEDFLAGYLSVPDDIGPTLAGVAQFLRTRLPGKDITPEQLRNRSWWSGPEAWVLIDDYDLVANSQGNPAAVLQPLLAQSRDIGLHVVILRRSGGAMRALSDPLISTMTELGATGMLLSGDPDIGAVYAGLKFRRSNPGRAQVVHREMGKFVAQLAWTAPLA